MESIEGIRSVSGSSLEPLPVSEQAMGTDGQRVTVLDNESATRMGCESDGIVRRFDSD